MQDGAAFLLERRGDVASALKIYIQSLDAANRALAAAVRAGRLDLAAAAAAAVVAADEQASSSRGALHGRLPMGAAAALMHQRRPTPQRGGSTAGAAAASAAAALLDSSLAPPLELRAARDALTSAVAMCLRRVDRGEGHLQPPWGGTWGHPLLLAVCHGRCPCSLLPL